MYANKNVQDIWDCNGDPGNVWCVIPFSKSNYSLYLQNIKTGAKLSTYYDYSDQCIASFTGFASDFFYYYQNKTGKGIPALGPAPWEYQMFNITGVIANNFADSLYYCYLFENAVEVYTLQRWSTFVDINDFYTSFLFNLLS